MATKKSDDLESDTYQNCGICIGEFQDPRILNCFHTFCSDCLEPLLKKPKSDNSFDCPLCRQSIRIPKEGVNGFQRNFYNQNREDLGPYCGFCGNRGSNQNDCIECDIKLCESCTNMHRRMQITKYHTIVSLKSAQVAHRSKENMIQCDQHLGLKKTHYCTICNVTLCIACQMTCHADHPTEGIADAAGKQRRELYQLAQRQKEHITPTQQAIFEALKEKRKCDADVQSAKQQAIEWAESCKREIDKKCHDIVQYLENKRKAHSKHLTLFLDQAEFSFQSKSSMIESIEGTVMQGSDIEILDKKPKFVSQLLHMTKERLSYDRQQFVFLPGDLNDEILDSMLGSGHTVPVPGFELFTPVSILISPDIYPRLINVLKNFGKCKSVTSIAPISSEMAWINFDNDNIIHLFHKNNGKERSVVLPGGVEDMTTCSDGSLLITSFKAHVIWKISKTFCGVNTLTGLDDLYPYGICSTYDGIMVVCRIKVSMRKKTAKLLTLDGEYVCRETEKDNEQMIFCLPSKLSERLNGDICVCDSKLKDGRIVIISKDGSLKDTLKITKGPKRNFLPGGICCDIYGHVIVSDTSNDRVLMFDEFGDCDINFLTSEHGIKSPKALAIDGKGHLWVGNSKDGTIRIFKYTK